MTGLSGDNEIFVNYEAFKEKIDNLVFQYIRETFKIKKEFQKKTTGQPTRLCREAPTSTLFPPLHLGIMEMINNVQKPESETSSQRGDQFLSYKYFNLNK